MYVSTCFGDRPSPVGLPSNATKILPLSNTMHYTIIIIIMPLNSIQQLISSTTRSSSSYLMLLQHSLHQRHTMALEATESDAAVYRRARVRTPAQNAQRDYLGTVWLSHVAAELQKTAKGLVWLQTTGAISIKNNENVTILNAASNPFGWDDDEEPEQEGLTLENLPRLADTIQNEVAKQKRPVVVESLTPIVLRHGLSRTLSFLRQLLLKCNTTILVPILMETLLPAQHRALEDMAQAVLYLQGGDMTLIRQGVRERGNVLREVISFDISTNEATGAVSIEIRKKEGDEMDKEEVAPVSTSVPAAANVKQAAARSGKVKLELEDDNAPPASKEEPTNRPHIYVQDNDPEFDDMDEEDPDDDLDI